jgi:DNA gyrase subunit A
VARRKTPTTRVDPSAFDRAGAQVIDNSLTTEIEDSYLEYAYSVIHSRALPDARDGLKPVHRRILFSMNEQGHRPTSPYVKSSRVVGDCFVRGALVSTPAGLQAIERIEVGDLVLDPAGNAVRVGEVYENPVSELVRVVWANGDTMLVTPGQRFRTDDGEWTDARDLAGRRTTAFGASRHATLVADGGDVEAYVLGLVAARGVVEDGRVQLTMAECAPLDTVHGWAIAHEMTVTRDKYEGSDGVDLHVLAFDPDVVLLNAVETVPAAVVAERKHWAPFLAGLFDGAGHVHEGREIGFADTRDEVYAMLADAGVRAERDRGLWVSGRHASALAAALLRWTKTRHDDLVDVIRAARAEDPVDLTAACEVVAVEPADPDTTYDIQVEADEHAFVVAGQVVHNCMGKYHPHGDGAIYDAMVRLAQDFSLNTPLIDGHGNFGSPDDGPAASRYCVVGDTRIRLADGSSPRIADLVSLPADSEADADFEVLDKDGKAVRVDKVFNSGVHPTIRMTTKSGFSVRGSENHLVLCLEAPMGVPLFQWRRLDELKPGAVVAVARNAWSHVIPTAREYMLGVLGGAWVSEGFASESRAGFNNTDEHYFGEVLHAYDQIVGGRRYVAQRHTRRDRKLIHELDVQEYAGGMDAFRAGPLAEFIGHQARDKFVPEFVWNGGWGVKRAFLMAAFEGDGGCREAGNGFTVQYSTYSPVLASQLQELLAEFGVVATRRSYRRTSGSVEYRLVVSGLRNVRAFAERVGFLKTKQAKLVALLGHSPLRPHRLSGDNVPFVADYVRQALDFDRRGSGRKWLTRHNFDRVERWETERLRIIDRIKDTEVLATILPIMDSGYRFETVESVEDCEPAEVYSVRVVSEDHSFLAGGFVNHNTEARMSPAAMLLVGELDEETVDFRPNYDGSLQEPSVLPAAFPNLLVNGTSGIAVGMATNMIPHNLGEVVAAARWLVNHPDADLDKLMEFIPGPDLPTGGVLLGLDEVRKAYETGRGVVRMRAKVETGLLEGSRGRQAITVTELPYGVGPGKIIEKITDEVTKSKRLTGISDVKDLTDRKNGTRVVIECKVGVNPQALLSDLYR